MPQVVVAKKIRDNWIELWWQMAKGNPVDYETIKAMNVFEFYSFLDAWQKDLKIRNSQARQQQAKNKR